MQTYFGLSQKLEGKKEKNLIKPFVAAACSKEIVSCGICIYIKKLNVSI